MPGWDADKGICQAGLSHWISTQLSATMKQVNMVQLLILSIHKSDCVHTQMGYVVKNVFIHHYFKNNCDSIEKTTRGTQ